MADSPLPGSMAQQSLTAEAAATAESAEDSDAVSALRLHSVLATEEASAFFPSCARQHWLCQETKRRNTCNICDHRGTEYRCSLCDYDLCRQCYTKAKLQARLGPSCYQLHLLKPGPRIFNWCDRCGERGTAYRCPEGCDFDVCVPCYDEMNVALRVPLRGLGKQQGSSSSNPEEDEDYSTLTGGSDAGSLTGSSVASRNGMAKLWREAWETESQRSRNEQPHHDSDGEESPLAFVAVDVCFVPESLSYVETSPEAVPRVEVRAPSSVSHTQASVCTSCSDASVSALASRKGGGSDTL